MIWEPWEAAHALRPPTCPTSPLASLGLARWSAASKARRLPARICNGRSTWASLSARRSRPVSFDPGKPFFRFDSEATAGVAVEVAVQPVRGRPAAAGIGQGSSGREQRGLAGGQIAEAFGHADVGGDRPIDLASRLRTLRQQGARLGLLS